MSYLHDQTLEDFVNHEHSRLAHLLRVHVLALRLHASALTASAWLLAWMAPRLGRSSGWIGALKC